MILKSWEKPQVLSYPTVHRLNWAKPIGMVRSLVSCSDISISWYICLTATKVCALEKIYGFCISWSLWNLHPPCGFFFVRLSLPLLNELRALRRLRHPNIVLFLAAHVVSGKPSRSNHPRLPCLRWVTWAVGLWSNMFFFVNFPTVSSDFVEWFQFRNPLCKLEKSRSSQRRSI